MSTDDAPDRGAPSGAHEQFPSPDEHTRKESRRAVEAAILRMARAAGAPIHQRPISSGSTLTTPTPGRYRASGSR